MTEYLSCSDKECVEEWKNEGYDDWYNEEHTDFLPKHCEVEVCHTIYIKGKNGHTCVSCGLEVCESCSAEEIVHESHDTEHYCIECYKEICKEESIEWDYHEWLSNKERAAKGWDIREFLYSAIKLSPFNIEMNDLSEDFKEYVMNNELVHSVGLNAKPRYFYVGVDKKMNQKQFIKECSYDLSNVVLKVCGPYERIFD